MINYYRILQLKDFSERKEVQKAFHKLAKKYHPDVNNDPESEELFKLVNNAYTTLSDPTKKDSHDKQLRYALQYDHLKVDVKRNNDEIKKKQQAWAKKMAKAEFDSYAKKNRLFPFKYRFLSSIVVAIWGLQLVYSNWFVNLHGMGTQGLIFGFVLFLGACMFFLNTSYVYFRIKNLQEGSGHNYENLSFYLFFGMLLMGPSLIIGLNTYRKYYHLKNYPIVEKAQIETINNFARIQYSFTAQNGDEVLKTGKLTDENIFDARQRWVLVKYSEADPRICVMVEKD